MRHGLPADIHAESAAGITSGRRWSALPTDGEPSEWAMDPQQGRIQGPLGLNKLDGQRLSLILQEGHQALLVQDGHLKAVYLDGAHYLEIGSGQHQVHPACDLIMMDQSEPLQLSWPRSAPLIWGQDEHEALIGSCTLSVDWPSRFFANFLQGHDNPDPGFTTRMIDQMVRGLFAEILTTDDGNEMAPGPGDIQERLMQLMPDDLNDDLHNCGLNCTQLAVFTLAPPVAEHETNSGSELKLVPNR